MGKRVSISQPAVIQTELRPLDESFWIDANGQLEQWYYQNTGVFSPDRQITPLKLTPHLSAKDADTDTAYTPTFSIDRWEVKEYVNGAWVTREITSLSPSDAYSIDQDGLTLIVAKNNYDAAHAINVTCHAKYNDPRDTGVQCWVSQSTMLLTSIDATQVFPVLNIENPATRMFNPLKDDPIYEFEGSCDWSVIEGQGGTNITEYKADPLGTEEIIQSNDEQMINAAPLLDIKYGDTYIEDAQGNHVPQQFMLRQTSGGLVPTIVDGVAKIENIKGNTVAWNQNAPFITQNNYIVYNENACSVTVADGVANVIVNNYEGYGSSIGVKYSSYIPMITGHTYYFSTYIKTSKQMDFGVEVANLPSGITNIPADNNFHKLSFIISVTRNFTTLLVSPRSTFDETYNTYSVKNNILIDLTQMLGAGNEPSTVAEFESWLATNIGLKDYYEYYSGKLINYGGFSVKWNQLVQNGDFSDGVDGWNIRQGGSAVISTSDGIEIECKSGISVQSSLNKGSVVVRNHTYYIDFKVKKNDCAITSVDFYFSHQSSPIYNFNPLILRAIPTTSWQTFKTIAKTLDVDDIGGIQFYPVGYTNDQGDRWYVKDVNLIDLTLMFGAGNEPDLDWCNKYLSRDYYDYCPALDRNIMDIMETKTVVDGVAQYKTLPMGIKTTGFNWWDEQTRHGYYNNEGAFIASSSLLCNAHPIKILGNTDYYFKTRPTIFLFWYDIDMNLIEGNIVARDDIKKSPQNAVYLNFYQYGSNEYTNDTCINISNPPKDGTYEPHWESFSDTSWITKIGIENFNIWDEEWEVGGMDSGVPVPNNSHFRSKNFSSCESSSDYYINIPNQIFVFWYDSSKSYLSYSQVDSSRIITSPSNAKHFKINDRTRSSYNYDICINKSIAHFNGRYYPYGVTAPYFPNGLCNVGTVYDEVKIVDGKIKGVVRIGRRDYASGDESDSTVVTDGTNTQYELATSYEFEIDYPTKGQFEWYGINTSGQEVPIDQLPVYSQATQPSGYGQGTSKININALYGEDIAVILRVKRYPWSTNVLPPKEYRNVTWRIPPVDVQIVSDKGSAVRAQNQDGTFTFSTIVNQQGDIISDEVKEENMVFDWYYASIPNSGSSSVQSAGSGLTKTISAGTLKNTRPNVGETPSTNVWCEAFVLGAYHLVDGEYVRTKD